MSNSRTTTEPSAPESGSEEKKHFYAPDASATGRAPQFRIGTLSRSSLNSDPLEEFSAWYSAASSHPQVTTPYGVCLSTASLPSGKVSSRFVYLKEVDARGFVIYSNWGTSQKASDINSNPHASLAFWWEPLERQVRVEGTVERLTQEESQRYYATRARGSKLGAWASQQSAVLEPKTLIEGKEDGEKDDGRAQLDGWVTEQESRFENTEDQDIPCPPFWGGLRVIPNRIEFWQGRDSRLHDRFVYIRRGSDEDERADEREKKGEVKWRIERLSP